MVNKIKLMIFVLFFLTMSFSLAHAAWYYELDVEGGTNTSYDACVEGSPTGSEYQVFATETECETARWDDYISYCQAQNSALIDIYDTDAGWIDDYNRECIWGQFGTQSCFTSDQECDGRGPDAPICYIAGVYSGQCDNCSYIPQSELLCNSDVCNADDVCHDLVPGTEIPDPSGDGTVNYCGGGTFNYECRNINTDICRAAYGADSLCDGIEKETYGDFNLNGNQDYCNSTCQFNECYNNDDSMCPDGYFCDSESCLEIEVCDVNDGADPFCDGVEPWVYDDLNGDGTEDVCDDSCTFLHCYNDSDEMCPEGRYCKSTVCDLIPGTFNVPEFNSNSVFFLFIFSLVGIVLIHRGTYN